MGMLSSFFNPGKAYRKGQEQLDNYYNQAQAFNQPYMQQGHEAYGNLQGAMQSLLNPAQLHNEWAQGYEMSPYARQMQDMSQSSGLNAASSMGLLGSSPALQSIQAGNSMIGAQDRDNYLNSLMQKYMQGAQLAQGIYGTGAQFGQQSGQNAMNMGQNSAQMAYGEQAAPGNMFGNLLGTAAGVALGGPIGGALANKFIGNYQPWQTSGGK